MVSGLLTSDTIRRFIGGLTIIPIVHIGDRIPTASIARIGDLILIASIVHIGDPMLTASIVHIGGPMPMASVVRFGGPMLMASIVHFIDHIGDIATDIVHTGDTATMAFMAVILIGEGTFVARAQSAP